MPCFVGQNSITCYRGIPNQAVSLIKTKHDGKVYLSRYQRKLFNALDATQAIELYHRRATGEWVFKKFQKSYLEFVKEIDDAADLGKALSQ